ncbi:reverse transcriptase family protein [Pseudomonadales bacterium]|nr:reverse transcriptase family protein [Pseudomonadales bacterium]
MNSLFWFVLALLSPILVPIALIWLVLNFFLELFISPNSYSYSKLVSTDLALKREERLIKALGASTAEFWDTQIHYHEHTIPKKIGGFRTLNIPSNELKVLQKKVAGLIERYHGGKIHGCANAFYKGRSILTNARPHLGCEVLIKLDIVDFFPSVNREHARNSLRFKGIPLQGTAEAPNRLENRLLDILFLDHGLPQGAPSSPLLSNLVMRDIDLNLSSYAKRYGGVYTRYADDISISYKSEDKGTVRKTIDTVDDILSKKGFRLNRKRQKLHVLRRHQAQRICGVTINSGKMTISRHKRREVRAIKHRLQVGKEASMRETQVAGWDCFLDMVAKAKH